MTSLLLIMRMFVMTNKMILTLGLLMALIPSSYSLAKGHWKQKWDELNITEAQKQQVSAIRKKNREKTQEEIVQVLTPEQRTKWQEMKKTKKASNKKNQATEPKENN